MSFTPKELEIITYGVKSGKSREEVENAVARLRSGLGPKEQPPAEQKPSALEEGMKDYASGFGDILKTGKEEVAAAPTFGEKALRTVGTVGAEAGHLISPIFKPIQPFLDALTNGMDATTAAVTHLLPEGFKGNVREGVTKVLQPVADYINQNPEEAQRFGTNFKAIGNLMNILGLAEGVSGAKSALSAGKSKITGVIDSILPPEGPGNGGLMDDAFNYASDLKTRAQKSIAESTASPQLKTSAERLFLNGTERLENPIKVYDDFLAQSKKALSDTKADPAIATVGEEIGDALTTVIKQRRAVGETMGEELKKIGGIKTDIAETYTNLETSLKDADLRYNGNTKKITPGKTSKMTKEDIGLLQKYILDLNKLGQHPTIAEIDAHIARTNGLVNNFKAGAGITETTNAERLIKASQSSLRQQFDPVKMKNPTLEAYSKARKTYADLSNFIDEGSGYVGKLTQSGDFAKDASLAKSAVQSVLNNGKKDWLIQLEALTGKPILDRSVLALQAMKDAGDFRGLSLLQVLNEGSVPTSKAGFTQKMLDFAVQKSREAIAGSPEEQTRIFLQNLSKQLQ